jgi:hypothetical protein
MNQIIRELKRQAAGEKLTPEQLKGLIRAGYVYRNGDEHFLTDKGRDALAQLRVEPGDGTLTEGASKSFGPTYHGHQQTTARLKRTRPAPPWRNPGGGLCGVAHPDFVAFGHLSPHASTAGAAGTGGADTSTTEPASARLNRPCRISPCARRSSRSRVGRTVHVSTKPPLAASVFRVFGRCPQHQQCCGQAFLLSDRLCQVLQCRSGTHFRGHRSPRQNTRRQALDCSRLEYESRQESRPLSKAAGTDERRERRA